jgi:hypothetical protein
VGTPTSQKNLNMNNLDDEFQRRASIGDISSKIKESSPPQRSIEAEWDALLEEAMQSSKLSTPQLSTPSASTLSTTSTPSSNKPSESVVETRSATPTPEPSALPSGASALMRRKRPGQSQSLDLLDSKQSIQILRQEFSSRDPEEVFQVLEKIGEGATGAVFKALHKETQRVVAIKK